MKYFLSNLEKFYEDLKEDEEIYLFFKDDLKETFNKSELLSILKSKFFKKDINNDDAYLISESGKGIIIGKDELEYLLKYNYRYSFMNNNTLRSSSKSTQKSLSSKNIYDIEVAIKSDNNITNIKSIKGTKKECIEFINNYIKNESIKNFFKSIPVINLNINDMNDNVWYTVEQLEKLGLVTLR